MAGSTLGLRDFKEGEQVILVVRHHWFVLLREVFGIALLFILPFFLLPMVFAFSAQTGNAPHIPGGMVLFFGSLWTLVMWHILFERWTDYYYDIWVVTSFRIIDIDQKGFFHRTIATMLTLDHIEDIETEEKGIFGSVLNFGSIQVQTAAARVQFRMPDVPNPNSIERVIRSTQAEHIKLLHANSIPPQ
jgi:membrane protein YdbS with pleckstrin-like domain